MDRIAWIVALALSGVAAGMFLMDVFAYYPLLRRLSEQDAIRLHNASVGPRRAIFRSIVRSSGIACIVLIVFFSNGAARSLLIGSLACLILLVIYTNVALIPLNREIAGWKPTAPPGDWRMRFSEMIARERFRGLLPAVAFVMELVASRRFGP